MRWTGVLLVGSATLMNAASVARRASFGKTRDGASVSIYRLTNQNGLRAQITNYGGILTSLQTPDRRATITDIVLGLDSLDGYLVNPGPFFGALIGRYANHIGQARFALTRVPYQLDKNDGENTLHGGPRGFDKRAWTPRAHPDGGLELTYLSKDGDGGFPGNLQVAAVYHLTDANELRIDYTATTDKVTV